MMGKLSSLCKLSYLLDAPPGTQNARFGGVEAGAYAGNHLPHEHRFGNASQLVHLIWGLR